MTFKKWFERQFGKRPKGIKVSDYDLQLMINDGYKAQKELDARLIYDEMWKSAFYSWRVREEDKK